MDATLLLVRERLHYGQGFEGRGTVAGFAAALGCYREALTLLEPKLAGSDAEAEYLHGVIWMNLGNVLRKKGTSSGEADAVHAYDQAIAILGGQGVTLDDARRNSLGAAWLNRGVALHEQGSGPAVAEALRSLRVANGILGALPLEKSPWYRSNRAAVLMNLGNALLDSNESDRLETARAAACAAVGLTATGEQEQLVLAELGLKARRVWCDALGQLLPLATDPTGAGALADEAGDVVDEGLALFRRWDRQPVLGPVAVRLFRFGAQLHRLHQPQFFAEFLEENLRALRARPGGKVEADRFAAVAHEEIENFLAALEGLQPFDLTNPQHRRLLEAARAVRKLQVVIG